MHPELAGLLHTARFAIDDEAPRQVVADWLEENGDEHERLRAEYVRLCLTLDRLPPWSPERPPLAARRRELEGAPMRAWVAPLREFRCVGSLQHERGMISLHLDPSALDRLDELFACPAAAWVEGVRCWGWQGPAYERLLLSPLCGRFASLGLGDCREEDVRPVLTRSPHLKAVRHLLLINANLSSTGWAEVVESGRLPPLEQLCLLGNRVGRTAVAAMKKAGLIDRVGTLDLSQNQIGPQGIQAVARLRPAALRSLDIGWNRMADRGLTALAASPMLRCVERLELSSNEIGTEGVEALAASAHLRRLESLDLSFNAVDDAGAAALARSPLGEQLRALDLRYNRLGDAGAEALRDSPLRGRLHRLDLTGNTAVTAAMRRKLKRAFKAALV